MPPNQVPQKCYNSLARVSRQQANKLKNLTFSSGTTSFTASKTADLRFDVHQSSTNPAEATGIIQANTEATNHAVKNFKKGKTGGHKGTHQVIGEKIKFPLGSKFNIEALAKAIETAGAEPAYAPGSGTEPSAPQSDWVWSDERQQYWRVKEDGSYEWSKPSKPEGELMHEWQWSHEYIKYYRYKEDGSFEWQ